ncbi:DnaD domain protein [Lactobacillus sp. ESL0228]|uniref:DnaD domain protein n=1 Tax=Lactobacillus sp. ESL0228 TaxID=2069352 RepID=UPI0018F79E2D|nr:DnaD domain protein [Lactobacillus sp. ESL0228]
MYETPNPKQPFFITNRVDIFPGDLRVLIKLYQPLIGSLALSLYLSMIEDYDSGAMLSDAKGIYILQEQLDCDINKLLSSLHKLEAVGLVRTSKLENQIMGQILLFSLKRVPSSSEFFSTALLTSLLKEKVGITMFQSLSHEFARESQKSFSQINGLKSAKDVSASFIDVFRLSEEEAIDPSPEVKKAAQENQIVQSKPAEINPPEQIDWEFMKQQFEIYQIAGSEIERNRPAIQGLMRTYGLSEQEFVDETLPCLHGDYHLNMPLIKQTIANSIHAEHTRQNLKQQEQASNKSEDIKHFSIREQQVLQLAQSKSPAQFIYQLKSDRHDYVDASEYQVLDNLYNQKGISADLLNILTYACLKSAPNVSYRLANKILHDWLQHGVQSGAQAIDYMDKREQDKFKKQQTRSASFYSHKPVEKGTDWSKKKSAKKTDVSTADLKQFFKNFEDQNGMK